MLCLWWRVLVGWLSLQLEQEGDFRLRMAVLGSEEDTQTQSSPACHGRIPVHDVLVLGGVLLVTCVCCSGFPTSHGTRSSGAV